MRSKSEIKEKLLAIRELIRNQVCVNSDLADLLGQEKALEWVIEDKSDDSWMFELQE